jgi:hypothetical protein
MHTPAESEVPGKLPAAVIHEFAPVARELLACDDRRGLLRGERRDPIRRLIGETIESVGPGVLSFDVFDTFLLRNGKAEARRFLEISQLARRRCVKALALPADELPSDVDFLIARADAMTLSYRTRAAVDGCREGHIREVVGAARRSLGLPREADAILLKAEIDCEVASLAINPVLLDVARDFRASGGKVILVSDMYLGKEEIGAVIRAIDPLAADVADEVFSSADHIVSKRSGKIFPLIEKQLQQSAEEFIHIGDALEGDVFQPRAAGWHAMHFPVSLAELARRSESLSRFVSEMSDFGHDVTRWAKV